MADELIGCSGEALSLDSPGEFTAHVWPSPLTLREFLEARERERASQQKTLMLMEYGEAPILFSGHSTCVVAAQPQLCPVEFPGLKRGPRQVH